MYQRYYTIPSKQIQEAKEKELASWIQGNVYKEVLNEGQQTILTCRIVSPKVIDSIMSTKAWLFARVFEEKED